MSIRIIADSAANVFSLADVDFDHVPLKIVTTQAEYVDDPQLDVEQMVDEIQKTKGRSGTSCPNVHEWLEAFRGAARVFAVTITSNLSGSYAAAAQAARDYEEENPEAQVCVIDTLSAGPEMRLIAERLRERVMAGDSFETIKDSIKSYLSHTHLLFSLESLTNLARNGRCSPALAKIAGVLGIRLVGAASDHGTLEPLHKCRGEKRTIETIFHEMKKRGFAGGKVRIAHCFNLEAATKLKEMILSAYADSDIQVEPCTGLCSFYAERGGMLIGYEDGLV